MQINSLLRLEDFGWVLETSMPYFTHHIIEMVLAQGQSQWYVWSSWQEHGSEIKSAGVRFL